MSLDWSVRDVANYEEIIAEGEGWNITNILIWGTMIVGLNEITAKNINEWMRRIAITNEVGFPIATALNTETHERQPYQFTRDQLERRVGLLTNATKLTKKEFSEKVGRMVEQKARQAQELAESRERAKQEVA